MVALWQPAIARVSYAYAQMAFSAQARLGRLDIVTRQRDFSAPEVAWSIDDWPVDGILIQDCDWSSAAELGSTNRPPLVSIGRLFDPAVDHVGIRVTRGIDAAISHLLSSGCRRIAFLTLEGDVLDETLLDAYRAACRAHRLEPRLISMATTDRAEARAALREQLASGSPPDGILAATDELAIAAMRGVSDAGLRVCHDVLVIGYGGTKEGEYASPALTSVSEPTAEMCRLAWDMLLQRIEESLVDGSPVVELPSTRSQVLEGKLIVRESSLRAD